METNDNQLKGIKKKKKSFYRNYFFLFIFLIFFFLSPTYLLYIYIRERERERETEREKKKEKEMANKRSFISSIGLLLSFIGMAGLVLSILSLLPLNGYNIYTTVITGTHLLQFELQKTHGDWKHMELSSDAKIYLIFLAGSLCSSLFEIILTFTACCRHQTKPDKIHGVTTIIQPATSAATTTTTAAVAEEEGNSHSKQHQHQQEYYNNKVVNRKSWFLRMTCFTLLIQIIFSLFGNY